MIGAESRGGGNITFEVTVKEARPGQMREVFTFGFKFNLSRKQGRTCD